MRGEAGRFPLDAETLRTVGHVADRPSSTDDWAVTPLIVVGRDTRESGGWLERSLIEGALEAGAECKSAGVITTPGVAFLARTLPADAGVVISASHNPYQDNGFKIFAPSGRKLDDETERLIEADILARTDKQTVAPVAEIKFARSKTQASALQVSLSGFSSARNRVRDYPEWSDHRSRRGQRRRFINCSASVRAVGSERHGHQRQA